MAHQSIIVFHKLFLTSTFAIHSYPVLKQFGVRPFLLSALLVVINDICAYLVGVPFGRTPLTKLSPKKSWCVLHFCVPPLCLANSCTWLTMPTRRLQMTTHAL